MGDLYGVDVSATGPVLHVVYLRGPTSAGRGPELEKRPQLWASPTIRIDLRMRGSPPPATLKVGYWCRREQSEKSLYSSWPVLL